MTARPAAGVGLFYHRDSEGHSDLAPPRYVAWAAAEAAKLGVRFAGTPDAITAMIARGASADGDLYLDYGVSGNRLSRPGFDACCQRALADPSVSHLFVPRRDRIARPDNPLDAMAIEFGLRAAGLTLVLMNGPLLLPLARGQRIQLADFLTSAIDYDASGRFRQDLAEKLISAKVKLAEGGFSIGGEPPYGFRRWLCAADGTRYRQMSEREVVKLPGHHVVWLPTAEDELRVAARIRELIVTTPAGRVARLLNDEGVPSPKAGRLRTVKGVKVPTAGVWTPNTVKNVATHRLWAAVCEYGKRAEGDQRRLTAAGPRPLADADYGADGRPRRVDHPAGAAISTPARFEAVVPAGEHAEVCRILEERAKQRKGKPRARGDAPNPLGGRVYDLNCGWPMYRYQRRGTWCYTCGLYQNSEAKCCDHNVVRGEPAARFVLAALRQRVLPPAVMAKLRDRLRELATADRGADPAGRDLAAAQAEAAAVARKLQTVGRNMALAETADERQATAGVFAELKAEEASIGRRVQELERRGPAGGDPGREVEAALAGLDRLADLATAADPGFTGVAGLFGQVDARLYLRFRREERGHQVVNVPAGGVLTFGAAPPPGSMYDGPTDRAIIRKMLAAGESVSPVPGRGAPASSETGQEVERSANVQRVTRRCT